MLGVTCVSLVDHALFVLFLFSDEVLFLPLHFLFFVFGMYHT